MDYCSPAISLLIMGFGACEYRRREKMHRAAMEHFRRGENPIAAGSQPRARSLVTTGSVCALLAGFAGILFFTGLDSHNGSEWPLEVMGGMITLPLLILILIFVRDVQHLTSPHDSEKESER